MQRVWVVAGLSATRRQLESLVTAPDVVIGSSPTPTTGLRDLLADVVVSAGLPPPDTPTEPPWVVLTDPPAGVGGAVRALLPRDASGGQLQAALQAVGQGLVCVHPTFALETPAEPEPVRGTALTPREQDVLVQLAAGLGNRDIAQRLGMSEHTVKFHLGAIFSKLAVSTRTEAVTAGLRQGLVLI